MRFEGDSCFREIPCMAFAATKRGDLKNMKFKY